MGNMGYKHEFKMLIRFMKDIRDSNYKNVGIVTDKDGTIILNENLSRALQNLKSNDQTNIWVIANSGRTVGDMITCLEKENIQIESFDYIIGDNGGMCVTSKPKQVLFKSCLDKNIASTIAKKFLQMKGTKENIRFADGEDIYAQKTKNVKKYYSDRKSVKLQKNVIKTEIPEVTKITLTGEEELIDEMIDFINQNYKECKTHKGKSSFPVKNKNNYRVDVTGQHDKGQATQYFRDKLNLQRCIFLGNDTNDLSMFYNAVDNNDYIVISKNEENDISSEIKENILNYAKSTNKNFNEDNILILSEKRITVFLKRIGYLLKQIQNLEKTDREKFMERIKARKYHINPNLIKNKVLRIKDYNKDEVVD